MQLTIPYLLNKRNYVGIGVVNLLEFKPSNKECRMCHTKHTELKLSDSVFVCPFCGHTEDRDLHAAQNIKRFGLKQVSEQAGIVCNVKCSSRTKLPRSSVRAKGVTNLLHGSSEAPAKSDYRLGGSSSHHIDQAS
jgi:putative transposase